MQKLILNQKHAEPNTRGRDVDPWLGWGSYMQYMRTCAHVPEGRTKCAYLHKCYGPMGLWAHGRMDIWPNGVHYVGVIIEIPLYTWPNRESRTYESQ